MSLDTYSGLQAAVLAKLMRTNDADAIARLPDWITMAENEYFTLNFLAVVIIKVLVFVLTFISKKSM